MAFQTNHTQPSGFVADAQLRDGNSLGSWLFWNFGTDPRSVAAWVLRIRKSSRLDRIVLERKVGSGGYAVVSREDVRQLFSDAPPTASDNTAEDVTKKYSNGQAWVDYVATDAELRAMGLTPGQPITAVPSYDLVPFMQSADGKVKPYSEPIDLDKDLSDLSNIVKSSFMTSSAVAGTPAAAQGAGVNWMRVGIVVVVVVGVVAGGVALYKYFTKKKR